MRFFVGLHQPSDAKHVSPAFISVGRLRDRKADMKVGDSIMDSQAFTTIATHGGYPLPVSEYAAQIRRWAEVRQTAGRRHQDYMCEPMMLKRTGLNVAEHQRLTIERYDSLLAEDTGTYIMPVLQGYRPGEYVSTSHNMANVWPPAHGLASARSVNATASQRQSSKFCSPLKPPAPICSCMASA